MRRTPEKKDLETFNRNIRLVTIHLIYILRNHCKTLMKNISLWTKNYIRSKSPSVIEKILFAEPVTSDTFSGSVLHNSLLLCGAHKILL